MKVLAILQNQWFHDPDKVREILKRTPQVRRRIIAYSLFAGCKTGQVLKAALGEEWCRKIAWEEASPEIGSKASSCFPADIKHILDVIVDVQPTVIIAFGKIAADAVEKLRPIHSSTSSDVDVITAPHPAARNVDALELIRGIRRQLDAALWIER